VKLLAAVRLSAVGDEQSSGRAAPSVIDVAAADL